MNFSARSSREALTKAKRRGKNAEDAYLNGDGNTVYFEFVGTMDLLELGLETEADEVWYEMRHRMRPMERRSEILPTDDELLRCLP